MGLTKEELYITPNFIEEKMLTNNLGFTKKLGHMWKRYILMVEGMSHEKK